MTPELEIVIGLETHAQLATETKLFCGCSTRFGAPPNTQTCPVCTGQPGVLPVLNRKAFEFALKTALALDCQINRHTVFDRKNYYYPDLPKNYQISQNYANLGVNGLVELEVNGQRRPVRIHNVHLEEDAGKLLHPDDVASAFPELRAEGIGEMSMVDLNRAGIPLLEIVTEPDMRSVEEARAYMETLARILRYLGVSECKMQEGDLRFEASISLRPAGSQELGNRVEIKNLNSMKAVVASLDYEARRQADALAHGEAVPRETRLWNEAAGRTEPMRSKELAHDYRYFPEPDLVPVEIDEEWLERLRGALPELPLARRRRFIEQYSLPEYDAGILTEERELADFLEAVVAEGVEPKAASNWIMSSVLREMNRLGIGIAAMREKVPPGHFARLIAAVADGTIAQNTGKEVFAEMVATGQTAEEIIERRGLRQISDEAQLAEIVLRVLKDNPKAAADLRSGKKKAKGFVMGQVMRATRGKANPQLVSRLIDEKLPEA